MVELVAYPPSFRALEAAIAAASMPDELRHTATALVAAAKAFDTSRAQSLGTNPRMEGVVRNPDAPADYTHPSVIGKDWADDPAHPLKDGEGWNAGRRSTASGVTYGFDDAGLPRNPYMRTGLRGRGLLGAYGPNHAIDNGIAVVTGKGDDAVLAIRSIHRGGDSHFKPAFSGGFVKYRVDADGQYRIDDDAIATSQAEEFFEEMVSGSITLTDTFAQAAAQKTEAETKRLEAVRGQPLSDEEAADVQTEIATATKLQMVRTLDPVFMDRLTTAFRHASEIYAGPVLADPRNTDSAWIETRLRWFEMTDARWASIKGRNLLGYDFKAGDDASSVVTHAITPELVRAAYASHGAMFMGLVAAYLAHHGADTPAGVVRQAHRLALV